MPIFGRTSLVGTPVRLYGQGSLATVPHRRRTSCHPPEMHIRQEASAQEDLPLAADGVLRYIWEGRFGPMLIDVMEGRAFMNGELVQTAVGQ